MTLTVHGQPVTGIFRLLGDNENSATYAVGWALSRCSEFRRSFVKALAGTELRSLADVHVSLQRREADGGYTDIEIRTTDGLHIVVEAKAGWLLPTERQLTRYCSRFSGVAGGSEHLVTISATPKRIAERRGVSRVGKIPVRHLSWTDVRELAGEARARTGRLDEKRWLLEVGRHLEEFVAMDRRSSNLAYVVSLSQKPIRPRNPYTWIDVVERDGCYFHPLGPGWPAEPPNYLGFRHHGRLQGVYHVESADIVRNLADYNPSWPRTSRDYFVYRLGPVMKPAAEIRTGGVYRAGRVWCAIDTLLSGRCKTISDARKLTKKRLEN